MYSVSTVSALSLKFGILLSQKPLNATFTNSLPRQPRVETHDGKNHLMSQRLKF